MAKPAQRPRSVLHPDGRPKFDKRHTKTYDPDKDPCLVGFQLGGQSWSSHEKVGKNKNSDIDAYDFYSDAVTGMRPGETREPFGAVTVNLQSHVGQYDCLPPLAAWQQGMWLWDAIFEPGFRFTELPPHTQKELKEAMEDPLFSGSGKVPEKFFPHYIVTGEGTPSNSVYRIYILPKDLASAGDPKHPMMWPERYKAMSWGSSTGGGGYGKPAPGTTLKPPNAVQLPPPVKVSLPASMRTRCGGCGHWWAIDDLVKHTNVCPGVKGQEESDMAMMCDTRCGCDSLDEAARCKPGFPRPKAKVEEAVETAEPSIDEVLKGSVTSNGAKAASAATTT